ncbi:hypothetical protein LZ554_002812 [Drepanopeziza brunnea f. sp. 'monogermtubi']|nr:hypothetical protein LZ554_002812 [Drepanopeziza brunnea f. sp. 'monogermtubi']
MRWIGKQLPCPETDASSSSSTTCNRIRSRGQAPQFRGCILLSNCCLAINLDSEQPGWTANAHLWTSLKDQLRVSVQSIELPSWGSPIWRRLSIKIAAA